MKKRILSVLQLAIGIGIVFLLLYSIHKGYDLVEFAVPETTVPAGCVYTNSTGTPHEFMVLDDTTNSASLRTLSSRVSEGDLPAGGILVLKQGKGPAQLQWTARTSRKYGLPLMARSFRRAGANYPFLICAALSSLLCLVACTLRWKTLLDAQGMGLPFWRVFALFFIGHFFNVLMPGAVGGDLVKAYYVAKEAKHQRTEAVATVFIDRVLGLLALILLCAVVMVIRLPFFLEHPETRAALVFNATLFVGAIVGLFLMFRRNLFERFAFFRRLEERTAFGRILSRAYNAFHICIKKPAVFFKAMTYSLMNHVTLVVSAYFVGYALQVVKPFYEYLTVFPIVNAVAAIPITPGGLGTREVATKFMLGTIGVPGVTAVPLSLLVYASLMGWSLIGGVVYIIYSQRRGRAAEVIATPGPAEG